MKKLACIDIGNTNIVIGSYKEALLYDINRIETDEFEIKK